MRLGDVNDIMPENNGLGFLVVLNKSGEFFSDFYAYEHSKNIMNVLYIRIFE